LSEATSLIVPFIALAILSVMIDRFTLFLQHVMEKIPGLPDRFEKPIAYLIVLAASYIACWRGDYSLFTYLNFAFQHKEEGYFFTALVISGGSMFLRESFSAIDNIPVSISSAYGAIRRVFPGSGVNNPADNHIAPEPLDEEAKRD